MPTSSTKLSPDLLKTKEFVQHTVARCKQKIPVPFDENRSYLALSEDGNFISLSPTHHQAQLSAQEWIVEKAIEMSPGATVVSPRESYYIVLLRPNSSWSKKYTYGKEDSTEFDEYSFFSARQFYDPEYLEETHQKSLEAQATQRSNEREKRGEEFKKVLFQIIGLVLFLIWLFGGFSWIRM